MNTILLWISVPLITTLTQLALKWSADALAPFPFGISWLAAAGACPYIWLAIACEAVNFAAWLAILKRHALNIAFPLSSIGYISVLLASWWVLKEPMQPLQLFGAATILVGIAILGYPRAKATQTLPSPSPIGRGPG